MHSATRLWELVTEYPMLSALCCGVSPWEHREIVMNDELMKTLGAAPCERRVGHMTVLRRDKHPLDRQEGAIGTSLRNPEMPSAEWAVT